MEQVAFHTRSLCCKYATLSGKKSFDSDCIPIIDRAAASKYSKLSALCLLLNLSHPLLLRDELHCSNRTTTNGQIWFTFLNPVRPNWIIVLLRTVKANFWDMFSPRSVDIFGELKTKPLEGSSAFRNRWKCDACLESKLNSLLHYFNLISCTWKFFNALAARDKMNWAFCIKLLL